MSVFSRKVVLPVPGLETRLTTKTPAFGVTGFVVHGKNEYRQDGILETNGFEQIEPVGAIERNVQHDDIG
jgi:hypothetical protein